jgi:hypothetical protein
MTLLLELLALELGGFMFGATQQSEAQNRLEHLRSLMPSARVGPPPKLLLFGRAGFSAELAAEATTRPDVELIGLDRLYYGA